MAVSDGAVRGLIEKCGLKEKLCREALAAHGGSVDAALGALIDAGTVSVDDLNPELVSDAAFGRAERLAGIKRYEAYLRQYPNGMVAETVRERLAEYRRKEKGQENLAAIGATVRQQRLRERRPELFAPPKEAKAVTLKLPPFPRLTAGGGDWTGKDKLASWAGFRKHESRARTKGTVEVTVHGPTGEDIPPAGEQAAAYRHLKENEAEVTAAVLRAVFKKYPKLREEFGYEGDQTGEEDGDWNYMPPIRSVEDLKPLVEISGVHVMAVAKAGVAYVGLAFHCTWDTEHDLGVMTHRSRVVEVGQADTSFDRFVCRDDGGKPIGEPAKRRTKGRGKRAR